MAALRPRAGQRARTGTASTSPRGCWTPTARRLSSYLRGAAVAYPLSLAGAGAAVAGGLSADALGRRHRLCGRASRGIRRGCSRRRWLPRRRAVRSTTRCSRGTCERAAVQGLHMAAGGGRALADGGDRRRHARAAGAVADRGRDGRAGQHADADRRGRSARGRSTRCGARLASSGRGARRPRGARGSRGGAPLRFEWSPLPVDVPFHSPALAEPLSGASRLGERGAAPALGAGAGRGGGSRRAAQFVEPVRWDAVAARSREPARTGCWTSARAPRSRG